MPDQNKTNQTQTPSVPTMPNFQNEMTDIPPIPGNTPPPSVDPSITPVSATPSDLPPVVPPSPKKKFGGGKVIASILGILLLVGGVGVGVYLTQQKQLIQQKAFTSNGASRDTCNLIEVSALDTGCPHLDNTGTNNVSTYVTHFTMKNITNSQHVISIVKHSNYCLEPYGDPQHDYTCGANNEDPTEEITLEPGASTDVVIQRSSLSGTSCGSYQTDLLVNSIDGNTNCKGGGGYNLISWGLCQTGTICNSTPTPTATPSPTSTSTPTTTATPTPTATPSPTSTSTPIGTLTPTPTAASLPNSGVEWPTMVGMSLGILTILGSLLLAL